VTESERLAIQAARVVADQVGAAITDGRNWRRANPPVAYAYHDAMAKGLREERVPFWRVRSAFHRMRARQARALAVAAGWTLICAEVAAWNDERVTRVRFAA
jgi:hypothetical protein